MINTEERPLNIQAATHPGMVGKQNEDRYRFSSFKVGPKQKTPSVLAVLCDGIGGHRAGEVAAEIAVSIITDEVMKGDAQKPLHTIQQAITKASDAIYAASQTDQGRQGMGTTAALAWVIRDRLYTANLGDSRIYLLRKNHLVQLTTDHTWVQEALDAGIIADDQSTEHPNAHIIRRYLGSRKAPKPDFRLWYFAEEEDADALDNQGLHLKPEDIILLCSDGLTDLVSDEAIHNVIQRSSLAQVPEILISMANKHGGHDNITIVLMQVPHGKKISPKKFNKRRFLIGILNGLALVSLLITALFFGLRWRARWSENLQTEASPATQVFPTATLEVEMTSTQKPTASPTATFQPSTPRPTITPWPTNTVE
jgi:PPM family protein phosphatase